MSNGFGPLSYGHDLITYEGPYERREYRLGASHNTYENYIDIRGLDSETPCGPWNCGYEINEERGRVMLPADAMTKIAAIVLRYSYLQERHHIAGDPWGSGEYLLPAGPEREVITRWLDSIIGTSEDEPSEDEDEDAEDEDEDEDVQTTLRSV